MHVEIKGLTKELRPVFDRDREYVTVHTYDARTIRVLLVWLMVEGGCWVSKRPKRARELLERETALCPRAPTNRVRFLTPADLGYDDYDNCVLENPGAMPGAMAWAKDHVRGKLRTVEPRPETSWKNPLDGLGLSVEERRELLAQVREGRRNDFGEEDVVASLCRDSLFDFVREFWDVVVPERYVHNWHIEYLCNEIQRVVDRVVANRPKEYDLVINVMPASTKSMILSVMTTPWTWIRMPSFRFIGGSYASNVAMDLSRRSREVVKSSKYQRLYPVKMKVDQDAKSFFMNEHGGMRMGVGTGGVAGFHGHLIGVDDPLDPNKTASEVELKAADEWIKNSLSQRKVDQLLTPTILIMQRLHNLDPTAMLLERADDVNPVRLIRLPAELSDKVTPRELVDEYVDGLFDPRRAPMRVLKAKKKLGNFLYSGQYMQDPVPLEGGMFHFYKVQVRAKAPADAEFEAIVRYWDKAGTQDGGCYTAGVKMGLTHDGEFWVLNVRRGQWDSALREKIIRQTAEADGRDIWQGVEQEAGSGGKESAQNTLRKTLRGFRAFADRPTGDKAVRADPFSVQVNDGNVYMVYGEWNVDYLDEMRFFPDSKFKDQIDASSGAFNRLTRSTVRVGSY